MKQTEFKQLIKECVKSVLNEMEQYDDQSDTFSSGPRDRMEPVGGGLGIVEFPEAIIKKHNLDGQERWFVYSSSDPQALIIGWGKTEENAIHNAKTTAPYIKHGGVGHTGDLKEIGEEHSYDEKEEIKLINDILVEAQSSLKKTHSLTNQDIVYSLRQIINICIQLFKMHGAKESINLKEQNLTSNDSNKLNQDFEAGKKFLTLVPTNNAFKATLYSTSNEAYSTVKNSPHIIYYISKRISSYNL